jgi:Recombination endonuclease VII
MWKSKERKHEYEKQYFCDRPDQLEKKRRRSRERMRRWRAKNPQRSLELNREYQRKHRVRLRKLENEKRRRRTEIKAGRPIPSACEICGQNSFRVLDLDHDHKTGKLRGFLCSRCNVTLGKCDDDIKILQKMILYLTRNSTQ